MSLRRACGVLAAAGVLALLVWVSVRAQSPRPKAPKRQSAPARTYVPTPPTRFAPGTTTPGTIVPGTNAYHPVQPANASIPYAPGTGGSFPSDASLLPVKLQLAGGLLLEGNIEASGPFPCAATFGEVSIPLTAIRGIRLHAAETNLNNPLPAATIILHNNDSLTVSLRATQIQIKTAWGTANVDLPHVQSLLLTQDDVQWQQAGDHRWILAPVDKTAPTGEATEAEAPADPGTTTPTLDVSPTFG